MNISVPTDLDPKKLSPYQKRHFVPENADLTDVDVVKGLYQKLIQKDIQSAQDLEQWLLERSELEAALDQTGSVIYIRMTCQTDDCARSDAYKHFIETIEPAVKPLEDQLNKKYLQCSQKYSLDEKRYGVLTRAIKQDIELFVKENIPLQTQISLLSQEYQSLCGAMTVEFQGEEKTLPQMGKYLLEPDRALRESAWRAVSERRLKDKDKLDSLFDKMLALRDQVAKNTGCANFCEYKFKSLHRFDYTPDQCKQYHDTIERAVVPLWRKILQRRKQQMGLDILRPWDLAVDPLGRAPLKPFETVDQLIDGCKNIFKQTHPDLGSQFADMADKGLLDLASRKGKAPGGYQSTLSELRKPFIFMNAVGVDDDIRTLLHEGGHAFHALACAGDDLLDYRHAPMEFCEVASMAMELLAGEYLDVFYNEDDKRRAVTAHFEGVVFTLVWVAIIDCFQYWIYENPTHNAQTRKEAWLEIQKRFGAGVVNWEGLEEAQSYVWHRQLHIFEVPFYYIEYGIAQLGALQVWRNAKANWDKALADYQAGLALGGSRPLPELYKTAGIKFDFSESTIAPLMEDVAAQINI